MPTPGTCVGHPTVGKRQMFFWSASTYALYVEFSFPAEKGGNADEEKPDPDAE